MKKLPALCVAGVLAAGLYIYKIVVPSEKLVRAAEEIAELRKNLETCYISTDSNHETSCSGQYKTPEEIVQARRKVIEAAGCEDQSSWRIRSTPDTIETRTVLANCGSLNSNWTMDSNPQHCPNTGKLVPFGYVAHFASGYRLPITDGAWWTRSDAGRGYSCIRE